MFEQSPFTRGEERYEDSAIAFYAGVAGCSFSARVAARRWSSVLTNQGEACPRLGSVLIKFNSDQPADQLIAALVILDASPNAVIFLRSSDIKTPKDLEGKTASTTKNDGTNLMFPAFARLTGIDADKLKWQHVEPRLRDTLVIRGQADVTLGRATTVSERMLKRRYRVCLSAL